MIHTKVQTSFHFISMLPHCTTTLSKRFIPYSSLNLDHYHIIVMSKDKNKFLLQQSSELHHDVWGKFCHWDGWWTWWGDCCVEIVRLSACSGEEQWVKMCWPKLTFEWKNETQDRFCWGVVGYPQIPRDVLHPLMGSNRAFGKREKRAIFKNVNSPTKFWTRNSDKSNFCIAPKNAGFGLIRFWAFQKCPTCCVLMSIWKSYDESKFVNIHTMSVHPVDVGVLCCLLQWTKNKTNAGCVSICSSIGVDWRAKSCFAFSPSWTLSPKHDFFSCPKSHNHNFQRKVAWGDQVWCIIYG